jgi:hypothetical protein
LNFLFLDPEVILDEPDPDDDGNPEEDYEGYEGYYDEEGGDESMTSDQGGQSESSQGRFQPEIIGRNIDEHLSIFDSSDWEKIVALHFSSVAKQYFPTRALFL